VGPLPVTVLEIASWDDLLDENASRTIAARLPEYLKTRRWFKSKERTIRSVQIEDAIPMSRRGFLTSS